MLLTGPFQNAFKKMDEIQNAAKAANVRIVLMK